MSDPAERRIGTVIAGKWRIDALLGSGSMAAVYAATHRNGVRAALKILHPTLCTDAGVCERFLGEGYLTNSVKHPGIVRVLDDGISEDECVFLVMDLLEGKTLEMVRQDRGGQMAVGEVLDLADKLMDVLHTVHAAGIIHRDLKPQNVFVCDDGSLKLLDFGVARVLDSAAQSKLSAFGLVLGTPSFMSPEQALGSRDAVDHRSDIWSLGATLFTALTGQTVHLGPHVQARLLAAATVKARSITMAKRDLPLAISAAIDTALRFKKEDRWQSVDAFRRALRQARAELPVDEAAAPAPKKVLQDTTAPMPRPASITAPLESASSTAPAPNAYGTLIGIGYDPAAGALHEAVTAATQLDVAKREPEAEPEVPPRLELLASPDDSYSGSSNTVELEPSEALMSQLSRRRGGSMPWVFGLSVAAIAIFGVGFFAIDRGPATASATPAANVSELTSAQVAPQVPVSALPQASVTATAPVAPVVESASSTASAEPAASLTASALPNAPSPQRTASVMRMKPSRPAPHSPSPSPRPEIPPAVPSVPGRIGPEPPRPNIDGPTTTAAPDPFATPE